MDIDKRVIINYFGQLFSQQKNGRISDEVNPVKSNELRQVATKRDAEEWSKSLTRPLKNIEEAKIPYSISGPLRRPDIPITGATIFYHGESLTLEEYQQRINQQSGASVENSNSVLLVQAGLSIEAQESESIVSANGTRGEQSNSLQNPSPELTEGSQVAQKADLTQRSVFSSATEQRKKLFKTPYGDVARANGYRHPVENEALE